MPAGFSRLLTTTNLIAFFQYFFYCVCEFNVRSTKNSQRVHYFMWENELDWIVFFMFLISFFLIEKLIAFSYYHRTCRF